MNIDVSRLPFGRLPSVHLLVNDDNGMDTGRLWAVHIDDADGDLVVRLIAPDVLDGVPAPITLRPDGVPVIDLGDGHRFALYRHHSYTGNILWDGARMKPGRARALVVRLLERFAPAVWQDADGEAWNVADDPLACTDRFAVAYRAPTLGEAAALALLALRGGT